MLKKININIKILIVVFISFFAVYLLFQVISANYSPVDTQTVELKTIEKGVETTVFIVRDESYISTADNGKVFVPLVEDGERVAAGQCIAASFDTPEQADSYIKMKNINEQILHFQSIKSQNKINITDINVYDSETDASFLDYISSIRNNDYESAADKIDAICDRVTNRQIAMGESVDYSKKLQDLNALISQDSVIPEYAYADLTGYYISDVDGYENTVKYSDINKLTADNVEKIINSEPSETKTSSGKIVNNFNWYLVCVVTQKDVEELSVGSTVTVKFNNASDLDEKVTVSAINVKDKEHVCLVLKSNSVNTKSFTLRKESVKIVTETIKGYKIKKDALRTVDSVNGVFVLRGDIVNFRYVIPIYSEDDFVIVNTIEASQEVELEKALQDKIDKNKYKYVQLYDEVILKGKDLYDGKLI